MLAQLFKLFTILVICVSKVEPFNSFPGLIKPHSTSLNLFGGLFGGGAPKAKPDESSQPKAGSVPKVAYKLEKVSNTQGRDWKAEEAKAKAAKAPPTEIDLQPKSYNFGKSNEFPNLYKGWLKSGGDQIYNQMVSSAKKAISSKATKIELLFDPVPNLDEVSFGTIYNYKFRLEVAANLNVPEFATNRGGPSTLEWSNLYWANRLAQGLGGKVLVVSISGEAGLKGQYKPTLTKGLTLVSLSSVSKIDSLLEPGYKPQAVVILAPCTDEHYAAVSKLGDKFNCPAIALNAPFSKGYDIAGPSSFELAYVMKRIPKGWIFRNLGASSDFQAICEGPNYEITKTQTFQKRPTLPELSKVNMAASAARYGPAGNDRIFSQRL